MPYSYSPNGSGGEIAVLGRGRSEQTGSGAYHAHTTILDLLGNELLGVDAQPGQSNTGPLDAVQTGVLNKLCTGTGMFVCLAVLTADTVASATGADTHFSVAHATIGGAHGIDAGAAESNSSISSTGSCQTASGDSSVAAVNIAGGPLANVGQSSESSNACTGQDPSQQASSKVVNLAGNGLPLPAPGCDNGTPNTTLNVLGLLTTVCNADNTGEASAPAGVREALTAIVLPAVGTSLAKTVVSSSESHAVAANSTTCTGSSCGGTGGNGGGNGGGTGGNGGGTGGNGGNAGGNGGNNSGNGGNTGGGGSVSGESTGTDNEATEGGNEANEANEGTASANEGNVTEAASTGDLPFTGEDLLRATLVGLLLVGGGLSLRLRTREN